MRSLELSGKAAFAWPVTVEFEDVDSLGIVHHTRLIAYLERARVHLFAAIGQPIVTPRAVPVLRDLRTRFHRPAKLLDQLTVELGAEPSSGVSVDLRYRIVRGSELLVSAQTTIAYIDPVEGGVVPVPPTILAALEGWRTAAPTAP